VTAVRGGAFREKAQAVATAQRLFPQLDHATRILATRPLDEQRAGPLRQPADHGPVTNFRFGDEMHGMQLLQRPDIDPGDVVGDEQAMSRRGRRRAAQHMHTHPQDLKKLRGPAQDAFFLQSGGQAVQCPGSHAHTITQVEGQPEDAPQAQGNGCWANGVQVISGSGRRSGD